MSPARRFALVDILHVLDALPVGVMVVSPAGRVLHLNPALAALTGFNAEAARGLPCRYILRSRPCVAGCPLGCGSFGTGGVRSDKIVSASEREISGEAEAGMPGVFGPGVNGKKDGAQANLILSKLISGELPGPGGLDTDLLTVKKRKVPVRLTHFPLLDSRGTEVLRLDVVEDLTELRLLEQRLLQQAHGHGKLVGKSAAMERITTLIPTIAPSTAQVFITGETGTGKDILAETLHQASPRSREPFVRINISPLPEDLLAAELFGQVFPDAPDKPGRFQQAAGGTLYITEVADIPHGIQTRLVNFLDEGSVLPVGALKNSKVNVRLITATNRDPASLMEKGLLSQELFHRLNVVNINMPPLRERKEDIDFLLQHFLDIYAARFKKSFTGFSAEARARLADYAYPGNVRELKNIVEYAAMVCPDATIGIASLPAHIGTAFFSDSVTASSIATGSGITAGTNEAGASSAAKSRAVAKKRNRS